MKTKDELKPNYAPVYCAAMYPELCKVFHEHGYALAVHGSLARDMDLIAVPWAEHVDDADVVLASVCKRYAVKVIGGGEIKPHGRTAYTLSVGFGACSIDLSFMPVMKGGEA